ncbi:hypothetical protein Ocin01_08796 [Orchesella cincta]|uniref:Uncharacterized protein n=1 Tax=Orchesella cincta TaxID=48709 RepID=A0A1D2MZ09_ORCCI|nr:hypothetical protein Ocin01_08796 [Orchesella cincta]
MDSLMSHLKQEQNHKQGYRSKNTTARPPINRLVALALPSEGSLQRKRRPNEIERLQTTLHRPLNSVEIDKLYKGYRSLEKCTKRGNCDCYHCQLLKSTLTDESSVSDASSSESDNEVYSTIFCECFNKQTNSTVFKNKVFGATQEFDDKRISDELNNNSLCLPIYYKRNSADSAKKTRNCWAKLFNAIVSSFRLIGTLPICVILAGVKLMCQTFTFLGDMCKRRKFRKTYPEPIERKPNNTDVLLEVTVHQTP